MDKQTEQCIKVLNDLVVINNDRIEGYETAGKNTNEAELRTMFTKFAKTSHNCHQDLVIEITKLGGKPEEGTKISGKFFRAWMDVKSALTGKDREAILNSCEQGEEKAIETYKDTLSKESKHLSLDQQRMVQKHFGLIKADQSEIRLMQKALA
ncbi:MAG: PA2169 family four-helix-bundle protein [Balneolales bacterium]|nr:PA2169 family four-helix-bundle protein [Balneolales bacterium]